MLGPERLLPADLTGANLRAADLSGADIRRAVFSGADLTRAVLHGVQARNAEFSEATLTGVRGLEMALFPLGEILAAPGPPRIHDLTLRNRTATRNEDDVVVKCE